MKITAIKQQVKRPDRFSIFVDGSYAFSLNESQLIQSGVHSGIEIDQQTLASYKQESDIGKLTDRLLNLFSYRQRTEWEVREYLRRKGTTEEIVEQLVARLIKLGYINDSAFAQSWVATRRLGKPISRRKLRSELQAKRVPAEIIEQTLQADQESTDELSVLTSLIAKKQAKYPDQTKLMQYLARQGFSYGDIKQALAAADD